MKKTSEKSKKKSTTDILYEAKEFLKKNLPEGSHVGVWCISKDLSCFETRQEASPAAVIVAGSAIQHYGLSQDIV